MKNRFQRLAKSGRSMNFNVVCLKMIYDCGFDEHDFPRFTRCDSCAEARQTASQHMQSIKSQARWQNCCNQTLLKGAIGDLVSLSCPKPTF